LDLVNLAAPIRRRHPRTQETRAAIESAANEALFGAASIWEIAIKSQLGRMDCAVAPHEVARAARDTGFIELAIRGDAAAHVVKLPPIHRDPFDRMLIAQAIVEPALLYTVDRRLPAYSELVKQIG
jgi:PIN domain nuclease of toxin-antitoxin system